MNKSLFAIVFAFSFSAVTLFAQKEKVESLPLESYEIFTDLEAALQNPDSVYRLKIKKCKKCDSLPEAIFAFKNLQELSAHGVRLKVLNHRIGELKKLRVLDVSRNKLVRVPEEIGQLTQLEKLIINRNKIEELPESIGNLKKLELIDAWNTTLYVLPSSITELKKTLKTIDLRQIPLRETELEAMEKMLPNTKILFTSVCECENNR